MAVRLKITNQVGTIRYVTPVNITLAHEIRQPATLSCTFIDNLDIYETEDLVANPENVVQLNAEVILERDDSDGNSIQEFEGNITFKTVNKLGGGRWQITITAIDKLYQGRNTRASKNDADKWSIESPKAKADQILMIRSSRKINIPFLDPLYYLLPKYGITDWDTGAAPWLPLGFTASTGSTAEWAGYNSSPLKASIGGGSYLVDSIILSSSPIPNSAIIVADDAGEADGYLEFTVNDSLVVHDIGLTGEARLINKIRTVTNTPAGKITITVDVGDGITISSTPGDYDIHPINMKLSTDHNGLTPSGIGKIDTELIKYDGYDIDADGYYSIKNVRRVNNFIYISSIKSHTLTNTYTATFVSSFILDVTAGSDTDTLIKVTQNALFPVGATITVDDGGGVDLTIVSSVWNGTKTIVTVAEDMTALTYSNVITTNRMINIRPQGVASGDYLFEGFANSQWKKVRDSQYEIDFSNGIIISSLNPDIIGGAWEGSGGSNTFYPATAWRATYNYYDELTTSPSPSLNVETVIEQVVGESTTFGGWGLTSAQVFTGSTLPTYKISKAVSDEPQLSFEFIDNFLIDLNLLGKEDLVGYFWDSDISSGSSRFHIDILSQGNITKFYRQVIGTTKDFIMDELASGLIVNYQIPIAYNFTNLYFWAASYDEYMVSRPEAKGVLSQTGNDGDEYQFRDLDGSEDEWDMHRNWPLTIVSDGNKNTGYFLSYDDDPDAAAPNKAPGSGDGDPANGEAVYFVWFEEPGGYYSGKACNTRFINKIKCVLDPRKWANADFVYTGDYSIDIQVVGYETFTSPQVDPGGTNTIPTLGTEIELPGLRFQYQGQADLSKIMSEVTLEAEVNVEMAAIGIKFNASPTDMANPHPWFGTRNVRCALKQLDVLGGVEESKFIKIIDDTGLATGDATSMYAPLTYQKMVNSSYKVQEIDIGIATPGAATTIGRSILLQKLVLEDSREYVLGIKGLLIPSLMETIQIYSPNRSIDNYDGVVLSKQYTLNNGVEELTVLLRNFTSPLLT